MSSRLWVASICVLNPPKNAFAELIKFYVSTSITESGPLRKSPSTLPSAYR